MIARSKRAYSILDAGLRLASLRGIEAIRSPELAAEANTSSSVVMYHFLTMENFRVVLAEYAIERDCVPVIRRMIAADHPNVSGWSRRRCARYAQ